MSIRLDRDDLKTVLSDQRPSSVSGAIETIKFNYWLTDEINTVCSLIFYSFFCIYVKVSSRNGKINYTLL